jgi:hypothetical protein
MFHTHQTIAKLELRHDEGPNHRVELLPSEDVAAVFGERGMHARFAIELTLPKTPRWDDVALEVTFRESRDVIRLPVFAAFLEAHDQYHLLFDEFRARVHAIEGPAVLELGAGKRSGNSVSSLFKDIRYTGLDIVPGENVHVVGDAHRLSELVPAESFDAIFSISVFEHLAMPWKVALECNKVLKVGGLIYIATHQTWPLHDAPWDFWRFSSSAWPALFNEATGFRVVKSVMGLPATIKTKTLETPSTYALDREPAFLGSAVIVEKTGPTSLSWPVDLKTVTTGFYPA